MTRDYYLYEGTIGCSEDGCRSIDLDDIHDRDKPPVAIKVPCKGLAEYLEARSWDDAEERYITQGWIYDCNLFLQAVIIPSDKTGWPAKVIACANPDRMSEEAVIFGPEELINDPHPAAMDKDAFHAWLAHRNEYGLRPRNLGINNEKRLQAKERIMEAMCDICHWRYHYPPDQDDKLAEKCEECRAALIVQETLEEVLP